MILLHPVTAMRIRDHHSQRHGRREVAPEIFPVSVLFTARALPEQPADMASAIPIPPPAAQREKLCPPPAFRPFTPRQRLPVPERLRGQRVIGTEDWTVLR